MPPPSRRPLKDRLLLALTVGALRLFFALLGRTWRWRLVAGGEHLDAVVAGGRPALFCFWHDRVLPAALFLSARVIRRGGRKVATLASRSHDGEIATRIAAALGGLTLRGSSSRGGAAGLRGLLRAVGDGYSLALTVDGPKGPRHVAKPGAVAVARASGAPLLPLTWTSERCWHLRSWDRTAIPKPFATVEVRLEAPIEVPRRLGEEGLESYRRRLDAALGGDASL